MKKIIALTISILFVFFLLDLYAFQGIKTLSAGANSLFLQKSIIALFWITSLGLLAAVFYAIFEVNHKRGITPFAKKTFNIFISLFVAKLVFVVILLGEDIYRTVVAGLGFIIQNINANTTEHLTLAQRSPLVSIFAAIMAGVPFIAFIHGITKGKYNFKVRKETLYFNDLPEEFDGFTIVQISDIHAGSLDNPKAIENAIGLINDQKADLFVFTGDLVNNTAQEIEPWIPYFNKIKAPYGQFSILGNHDYGDYLNWPDEGSKANNMKLLQQHHASIGFRLLLDENVTIKKDGAQITLMGVENWGLGFGKRGNLKKALQGVEPGSFKVLLSHDPSHWDAEVKSFPVPVHLTLSGHTHGMQFGIEIGKFKWSPSKFKYPNWAGLVSENNKYLYVNRGFGFHGFSGRVGIWPEITILQLRKQQHKTDYRNR